MITFRIIFSLVVIGVAFGVVSYLVFRMGQENQQRVRAEEVCRPGVVEIVRHYRDGTAGVLCTNGERKWILQVR